MDGITDPNVGSQKDRSDGVQKAGSIRITPELRGKIREAISNAESENWVHSVKTFSIDEAVNNVIKVLENE